MQFCTSSRLRVVLLEKKDLTLTTLADTARAHEAAQLQARQMTDSKAESANAVKGRYTKKKGAQGPQQPVNKRRVHRICQQIAGIQATAVIEHVFGVDFLHILQRIQNGQQKEKRASFVTLKDSLPVAAKRKRKRTRNLVRFTQKMAVKVTMKLSSRVDPDHHQMSAL